jgi:hypothetical protein
MKRGRWLLTVTVLLLASQGFAQQPLKVTKKEYLAYAVEAAEQGWADYPEMVKTWRENLDLKYVFGYNPPANGVYLANLNAKLWQITGEAKYAERAVKLLAEYHEFKSAYPKEYLESRPEYRDGLPTVPNMFTFGPYVQAYFLVKEYANIGRSERAQIEASIAESADFFVRAQEWGAMNRAILRAEGFAYAAKVLPEHPRARIWTMMADAIGGDSLGKWEIEDASLYASIWLYSLLNYAEAIGADSDLMRSPIMAYYLKYYTHLISPLGFVPDYGDANHGSSWPRYIPVLERGATEYRDPTFKWAANRILRTFADLAAEKKSIWLGLVFADSYRWADDNIEPQPPDSGSEEVLEDVVGKKVVFRNGWGKDATYMLLNYRDEGDGGRIYRDYLRDTIPVEEEKMHHGHADENSIVTLIRNGSILLHDGGYRDYMPSGLFGAYRQDYFHNRVVVRKDKVFLGQKKGEYRYAVRDQAAVPGQSLLEFVRNSGNYRKVRTEKVDFLNLDQVDFSRTRVYDDKIGYQHERIVNYVKKADLFVVFDAVRFDVEDYYTAAVLWHTRKILDRGPNWFVTTYDSLRNRNVSGDDALLVYFPEGSPRIIGVEPQRRYFQEEQTIYQFLSAQFRQGDFATFTTVLIPHRKGADVQKLLARIEPVQVEGGPLSVAVKIRTEDGVQYVAAKLDLEAEMVRNYQRPRYTWESGKVRFDDFETNANNFFALVRGNQIDYTAVNAFRATYKGRVMWEQQPLLFGLRFDGLPDSEEIGKVRYWRDRYVVE